MRIQEFYETPALQEVDVTTETGFAQSGVESYGFGIDDFMDGGEF